MTLSPLRVGRVTGSVAGAILGLDPLKTRAQVLRQMVRASHGCPDEFIGNIATEYGNMNEPLAMMDYAAHAGTLAEESEFLIHPAHPWLGATPDGLLEGGGVLEIKCPFGKRNTSPVDFKPLAEQPHYYAQVQIEMACAGAEWAHFYQWSKWGDSLEEVPLDPEWHATNIPLLKEFHDLYLSELNNPAHLEPLRKSVDSPEALALVEEYDELTALEKHSGARKKEILAQLVAFAGGKAADIQGRKLTRVVRKGNINYAKIPALQGMDLEEYRGKGSDYWRFS